MHNTEMTHQSIYQDLFSLEDRTIEDSPDTDNLISLYEAGESLEGEQ